MKKVSFSLMVIACCLLFTAKGFSQGVAINKTNSTADASAMLDVAADSAGVLLPRVALTGTTDATTIPTAVASLMVYNTATVSDVTPGFYYWDGSAWVRFATGTGGGGSSSSGNTLIYTTDGF